MTGSKKLHRILPLALLAPLSLTPGDAAAQNLFDVLFGGGGVYRPRREAPPPPPPPPVKRAAPATIAAPSYYTYKPEPLVRLTVPVVAPASEGVIEAALSAVSFPEAMAVLTDLDLLAEKEVAAAIKAHYEASPEFIWVSGYHPNGRAGEAIRVLGEAGGYGLDPADYAVAVPPAGYSMTDMMARQRELAHFELALSARVLRYMSDAHRGRVNPNKLSGYHDFPAKPLDLRKALADLSETSGSRAYLEAQHPQNPEYKALRVELEALRASAENDILVDPKLLLKPGGSSPELPKLLRLIERKADAAFLAEHRPLLTASLQSELYGPELVPLIKAVQEKNGLKPDGVIGPRTVALLAGVSKADRITRVEVALEQLRWHPSTLGARRVFINQPAFTASYFEAGEEKLSMRTVIGKPSNQTSFFYDEIEQVDYNPYWGVPQSIIVNEMLPRLREDPGYLDRSGYEVTDSKGRRIPSSAIDWWQYGSKVPYSIRQTPSEANALGELKILFPNKHAIYMHDTPSKELFARDVRAFSHGCVRLQQPREMAAAVLGSTADIVAEKLKQGHSTEKVPEKIPVYVAYFTAWPDRFGKVQYFTDIYGRDDRVMAAVEKIEASRNPAS
jgi:L,D-transpeptidase YcbB